MWSLPLDVLIRLDAALLYVSESVAGGERMMVDAKTVVVLGRVEHTHTLTVTMTALTGQSSLSRPARSSLCTYLVVAK